MEFDLNEYMETMEFDSREYINKKIEQFNNNKQINCVFISSIEKEYETIGMVNYCYKKDVFEAKKNYYKSSLCREWIIENYEDNKDKIDKDEVNAYTYLSLYEGILSGNKEHFKHRAELFGRYSDFDKDVHPYSLLLGYSLKYVILEDVENANKWLDELDSKVDTRGMKNAVNGHGKAMRGIINHDEIMFNKGLEKMLKNHVSQMKKEGNTLEQYFAYDSVALAMIAKDRGINVTVKHDLLPDEYFVETDINYDEITML